MNNSYMRLEKMIGNSNIKKLNGQKVLIVGLGGVGGSCFDTLIRSAIENIYVCDFDVFEESNLNRQILCTKDVLGLSKVDVAEKKAKEINNNCNVIKIKEKLTTDNINNLLPKDIDYIIDACDDVKVKVDLVKFALNNNIKIISCMGTGNKFYPEKLEITNIWKTEYDPLAKKIRNLLKKEGITFKLPVVSSKENSSVKTDYVIGSFAPVPNTAGILLASYVLNDILK